MKEYKIGLLKGDGIGPEIVESAVRVLKAVGEKQGLHFVFTPYLSAARQSTRAASRCPRKR
jgi:3-isopropylmalate dehydrogenase